MIDAIGSLPSSKLRRRSPQRQNKRRMSRGQKNEEGGGSFARSLRAVCAAAAKVSAEYEQALWGRGSGGGHHRDGGVSVNSGMVGLGPLPRFRRWGKIGVLFISATSVQVDIARCAQEAQTGLLSGEAWNWLEDFFNTPEMCLQVYWSCRQFAVTHLIGDLLFTSQIPDWGLPRATFFASFQAPSLTTANKSLTSSRRSEFVPVYVVGSAFVVSRADPHVTYSA